MDTIEQRVIKVVAEQLGFAASEVKVGSDFVADLGADSLDIVEVVMALEDEFELEIDDRDAEKLSTVQDAITYLDKRSK